MRAVAQVLLVDGKLGGLTDDVRSGVRRLRCKLRYEVVPEHKWFLQKYIGILRQERIRSSVSAPMPCCACGCCD